jgi:hypothetical protein
MSLTDGISPLTLIVFGVLSLAEIDATECVVAVGPLASTTVHSHASVPVELDPYDGPARPFTEGPLGLAVVPGVRRSIAGIAGVVGRRLRRIGRRIGLDIPFAVVSAL